ncbi:cysteine hydrolase family protein [Azospirillum sp.]|uniref:cysteine hydrolase family protein n=1 Tax=Azospirillum sp. TaxID=34012 RepID=UPI002D4FB187|nr:cysteine hydrolase family protein [Azospirillum sp.]HYD67427.1 cysteine hydrolase family protein [Azospirillum sp.]
MTTPRSLLAMAGAPAHPAPFDRAALVIVDAQVEYTAAGKLTLAGIDAAVAETARLLDLARRHGAPVFHVVHHGKPGGALFDPEGPGSAIIAAVAPVDGEAVVVKGLPNSFAGTDLHERLKAAGRPELIVAGFQTHMCISATVRAALDLGYRNTLVAAATATRDLPDPLGGVVTADELQRAELAALADRFAIVVKDCGAWG